MLQLKQELLLKQTLSLTPRLILMFKILNLSYVDLLQEINKQVEENVTLEVSKDDELLNYAKSILKSSDERSLAQYSGEEAFNLENVMQQGSNKLDEHLISQLSLEHLSDEEHEIGKVLIENLDERGFLSDYKNVKAAVMERFNVAGTKVDKLLRTLQTFEPEGVGARNLKECLLIQVENYNFQDEALRDILEETISHHLNILKDPEALSDALSISEESAVNLAEFIEKNLSPNPAVNYNHSFYDDHIVPSFVLEETEDDEYKIINLEKKMGPSLRISKQYLQLLDDPNADPETIKFVKNKIAAAKEFLDHIQKRQEMIIKITDIINHTQKDYFKKGAHWLQPLQQNELADRLEVNPSTISRAVSDKYIQMPRGTMPIKYLLPRNFKGNTAKKIQHVMKDILTENPDLSDQKLCDLLNENSIEIKRRTVAKYRAILDIPSTRGR
ncbi:RNA polymerase factor sigma-54 [Candidatus Margulisiibacteriota bacterium]